MALISGAAWITAAKAHLLQAKEAPYKSPIDNELVICNRAIALNPVDFARRLLGTGLFPWTSYQSLADQVANACKHSCIPHKTAGFHC